jgi:hypothetical protein
MAPYKKLTSLMSIQTINISEIDRRVGVARINARAERMEMANNVVSWFMGTPTPRIQ